MNAKGRQEFIDHQTLRTQRLCGSLYSAWFVSTTMALDLFKVNADHRSVFAIFHVHCAFALKMFPNSLTHLSDSFGKVVS